MLDSPCSSPISQSILHPTAKFPRRFDANVYDKQGIKTWAGEINMFGSLCFATAFFMLLFKKQDTAIRWCLNSISCSWWVIHRNKLSWLSAFLFMPFPTLLHLFEPMLSHLPLVSALVPACNGHQFYRVTTNIWNRKILQSRKLSLKTNNILFLWFFCLFSFTTFFVILKGTVKWMLTVLIYLRGLFIKGNVSVLFFPSTHIFVSSLPLHTQNSLVFSPIPFSSLCLQAETESTVLGQELPLLLKHMNNLCRGLEAWAWPVFPRVSKKLVV